MHQIEIAEHTHTLLSGWDEVSPDLMLRLMPYIFHPDRAAAQADLLPLLSDIPDQLLGILDAWQLVEIMKMTEWLWSVPLTSPVIPVISLGETRFGLPAKEGTNMTLLEYFTAEGYLLAFTSGDVDALHKLTATMLRTINQGTRSGFDKRCGLDTYKIEEDVAALATLDPRVKMYVLWLFHGIRRHVQEQYAMLWQDEEGAPTRQTHMPDFGDEDEIDFSWIGVAYSLAEQRVFGNFEATLQTDIHTVLYYLCWKKQESRRREKEYEQQRERQRRDASR